MSESQAGYKMQARCWFEHVICWRSPPFVAVHERRKRISLSGSIFGPPNPARFQQPNKQLAVEVEGRTFITSSDSFGAITAEPLSNQRTSGNCTKIVQKTSSRKRRQSLRNSLRKKLLFTFSRVDSKQVPSWKCSASIAPQ